MNPQIQQLLLQFAQSRNMPPEQVQAFLADFAQSSLDEQGAFLQRIGVTNPSDSPQQAQQGGSIPWYQKAITAAKTIPGFVQDVWDMEGHPDVALDLAKDAYTKSIRKQEAKPTATSAIKPRTTTNPYKGQTPLQKEVYPDLQAGQQWALDWIKNRPMMQRQGTLDGNVIPHPQFVNAPLTTESGDLVGGRYTSDDNKLVMNTYYDEQQSNLKVPTYKNWAKTVGAHETTHALQHHIRSKPGQPFSPPGLIERVVDKTKALGQAVDVNLELGTPGDILSDMDQFYNQELARKKKSWDRTHQTVNPIQQSYDEIGRKTLKKNDPYLSLPNEIHARLMEWRMNTDTKPTDVITPDLFKQRNKKIKNSHGLDDLRTELSDEDIIDLLNKTVKNETTQDQSIQYAQQGGWSVTGYKRDSPHRHRDYNLIMSNMITMDNVNRPLALYGDGGEVIMAPPNSGQYKLPNSKYVLEVPLAQQGGTLPEVVVKGKKHPSIQPIRTLVGTEPRNPNLDLAYLDARIPTPVMAPVAQTTEPDEEEPDGIVPSQVTDKVSPKSGLKNPFTDSFGDYIPDLLKLLDAGTIEPGFLQQVYNDPLQLDRLNPLAARQKLTNAYKGALGSIGDPATQLGRAQAVQVYTNYLDSIANLEGGYDNQNTQIANSEAQYNNRQNLQLASQNEAYKQQFYQQNVGSREAARQQQFAALDGIFTKKAQNRQQQRSYELVQSGMTPDVGVGEDGRLMHDPSRRVTFSQNGISPDPLNTDKQTLRQTYDKNGELKTTTLTRQQQDYLRRNLPELKRLGLVKKTGGKAGKYQFIY